jgi:hypothetical protein
MMRAENEAQGDLLRSVLKVSQHSDLLFSVASNTSKSIL